MDINTFFREQFGAKPGMGATNAPVTVALPVVPEQPSTRLVMPVDRTQLRAWCQQWAGVSLPEVAVCPGHSTPLDYLEYVFFEQGTQDPLIWACRGGGKTLVGAVATLLDMLFKPGIEIRILGGSEVQAQRMYEHLVRMVETHFLDQLPTAGRKRNMTQGGFRLRNGSRVELLAQSENSVRGARVQKLRCDEVDIFHPNVWEAAQFTTRSKTGANNTRIRGSIEAFSTLNSDDGLMAKLIEGKRHKLFRWCVWDVCETCSDECAACILHPDCRGKAKHSKGFIPILDIRDMKERAGVKAWVHEILCDPEAMAAQRKRERAVRVCHY